MTTALSFGVRRNESPASDAERAAILADPGFGIHFSDHMATASWTEEAGWHDEQVVPFGPIAVPAAAAVLHYAQSVFEGLKCYRQPDGSVKAFRPDRNWARMTASAARLALPCPDYDLFLGSMRAVLALDHEWVPDPLDEKSLYLRPWVMGMEQYLGVRPSTEVTYGMLTSPCGSFISGKGGLGPVDAWLTRSYVRAAPGGTGAAKCGGNYAAGLGPYTEAKAHGCPQTVFLDADTHTCIEELGGMNIMFVTSENHLVTPALTGTILPGVTRASLLEIAAQDLGMVVEERRVSLAEWRERSAEGSITEVFACGTAAVITPLAKLKSEDFELPAAVNTGGEVTRTLWRALTDLQYGRVPDRRGWLVELYA